MKLLYIAGVLAAFAGLVKSQNCGPNEFECRNGQCISVEYICDGLYDCSDRSDEFPIINPGQCRECNSYEFKCDNGKCIASWWTCDGENDCVDGSDEPDIGCPACRSDQFRCASGHCIPKEYVCDGDNDCADNSDETCTGDLDLQKAKNVHKVQWELKKNKAKKQQKSNKDIN